MKKYRLFLSLIVIIAMVVLFVDIYRMDVKSVDDYLYRLKDEINSENESYKSNKKEYIFNGKDSRNVDGMYLINGKSIDDTYVIPLGTQVGVYLETKGVLVVATTNVVDESGLNHTPALDKIEKGDYIISLNNIDISSKSQLQFLIDKYGNGDLKIKIRRDGEIREVEITPVKVANKQYRIGVFVRDDTQGIGTVTYMLPNGEYGALGHGINDIDTKELLNSNRGILYNSSIWGISKGDIGIPGSICGSIEYSESNEIGVISSNTKKGIFGRFNDKTRKELMERYEDDKYKVAKKDKIKKGKAYIISCMAGERKKYEVEIESIDANSKTENAGMVLHVVDKELLELSNGIVQGMSGSPIVQEGYIIGAVTHVFVEDPTRGYGIFIDSMMEK